MFNGYFLDEGATKYLVAKAQFTAYSEHQNIQLQLSPSNSPFRLGISTHKCLWTFNGHIILPENTFMEFNASTISIDVPFLVVLQVFQKPSLSIDIQKNMIVWNKNNVN